MLTQDTAWFRVEHHSAVGAARRAAVELAEGLGLGEERSGEVGIVVGEIAGNQVKHGDGGSFLLRACRDTDDVGLEFVAIDSGAGMSDLAFAVADGHSTTGTLGIGLGVLDRLASAWDVYSLPGQGTVLTASFGVCETGTSGFLASGITRPMTGQDVCGDAYALRTDDDVLTVILADGLGHGPLAATASGAAVRAFLDAPVAGPAALMTTVHRALSGTRGAAVAIAQLSDATRMSYCGVGNISGHILDGGRHRGMISHPGIAGANARSIRETTYDLGDDAVVVMHSDGLSEKFGYADLPGLRRRSPLVIAATALRDFGTRHDDASVVAITPRRAA